MHGRRERRDGSPSLSLHNSESSEAGRGPEGKFRVPIRTDTLYDCYVRIETSVPEQ